MSVFLRKIFISGQKDWTVIIIGLKLLMYKFKITKKDYFSKFFILTNYNI